MLNRFSVKFYLN